MKSFTLLTLLLIGVSPLAFTTPPSRRVVLSSIASLTFVSPLLTSADEIGVSVDEPTLYTGESVEICKKRGVLGACKQFVRRTAENDNDRALKYMKNKPAFQGRELRENNDYVTGERAKRASRSNTRKGPRGPFEHPYLASELFEHPQEAPHAVKWPARAPWTLRIARLQ